MSQIATHDGKVVSTTPGKVSVQMHVLSACSSCQGHEKCAFADQADKIIEVETSSWKDYSPGDDVTVAVNESLGLLAVLLAYILPAILIIASVIIVSRLSSSEVLAAAVATAFIVIYFFILYKLRHRLQSKFSFQISKNL